MGFSTAEPTGASATGYNLAFRHLPTYAQYLLDERLEAFARHQMKLVRQLDVPLLKYFAAMSDEQFLKLAVTAAGEFLSALARNEARAYIDRALDQWRSNTMRTVTSEQIATEDITLISYARKQGLLEFADGYSTDPTIWKGIVAEADAFAVELETRCMRHYMDVQQTLYNEAQHLSRTGNFMWDLTRNTFTWSPAVYRIYEWEPGTPLDYERLRDATHPDDRVTGEAYRERLLRTREPYDYHYRIDTASGEKVVHARATLQLNGEGQPVAMIGTLQDVTERVKSEEALRASESRFAGILDIAQDAIIAVDETQRITLFNQGAEKIFGYASDEVMGQPLELLIPGRLAVRHREEVEGFAQSPEAARKMGQRREIFGKRKNGDEFPAEASISKLVRKDGITFTAILRDITERKAAEERMMALNAALGQSNDQLQSFAYVASHDLREPLRKIQTMADRIIDKEADRLSESARNYFERMQDAASRMDHLIEDLLAFSRTTATENPFERVDLNVTLEQVRSDLAVAIAEAGADVVSDVLPTVTGIPTQLHQLFQNLVANAIKFRKPEVPPRIRIESTVITTDEHSLSSRDPHKAYNRLRFHDNGIGFQQEYAERIFEMFQRLHGKADYQGTGIGLAICKRIVQNHGGTIRATGVTGVGAVFEVFLPM
jgi:PAS domain S-box-containing protein